MAIVTDPDNADRDQIIFNTENQLISLYAVDGTAKTNSSGTDGDSNGTRDFTSTAASFSGASASDILCLFSGPDAGHYVIKTVAANTITIEDDYDVLTNLAGGDFEDSVIFEVQGATGGSIADGITEQCVYSFDKEEWRLDSETFDADDLIQHEFPFEPITSEQFELGGGTGHADWAWFQPSAVEPYKSYTKNLVRTGGWAGKNTATTTQEEYAGIITLGALDADAQAYYQQVGTTAAPTDFILPGPVNQAVKTFENLSAVAAAVADDGGALTDETTEANEATANDMTLLAVSDAAVDDAYYFGGVDRFGQISLNVSTASAGTYTITWEYYDSTAADFVALSGVTDSTTGFTVSGLNTVTWTIPGTWVPTTINSQGPFYYIRARVSAWTSGGNALGQQVTLGDTDYRSYLKLFVRKKAKTYAQATIGDIGVSTIQTIVNRFPLSHIADAAISATDGAILGSTPWRNQSAALDSGALGSKTISQLTFSDAGATFQTNLVVAGDVLHLTEGAEIGYYTIASVDSETTVTLATDFEFTSSGWGSSESTLDWAVYTTYRYADKSAYTPAYRTSAGAGIIETGTAGVGTLTDSGAGFVAAGVIAGDILEISLADGETTWNGLYKVLDSGTSGASDPTATVIYVDTTDRTFPNPAEATVLYRVRLPGMYIEYKKDLVTNAAPANYAFDDDDVSYGNRPSITRADGTWDTSIAAGTILEITAADETANVGSFTVYARETATVLSLVPTDTLVLDASDANAVITVYDGFVRTIGSGTYGYNWRIFGNSSTLANVFQFVQHQLRQTGDIDYGAGFSRGDVTDLLMAFSTPTATMANAFIDNLDATDTNNVTYTDHSGTDRIFPYVAVVTINFSTNLQADADAKYWVYFSNDDAGDNAGADFSTKDAILVKDTGLSDVTGTVGAAPSVQFSYDYDGNVQRGAASAGDDAPITVVAIGLETAQYVVATGTIESSKSNSVALVSPLERVYSNV